MWPWMRDLPTSVWAGHGWAFDENGLRRLSSSGGSHAMQGVEVFESVGAAAEEVKPSDERIKEARACSCSCGASSPTCRGAENPLILRESMWRSKVGVPNVLWDRTLMAWSVKVSQTGFKWKTHRQVQSSLFREKVHWPWHLRGPGRRSSSRGRQGLPCRVGGGRASSGSRSPGTPTSPAKCRG